MTKHMNTLPQNLVILRSLVEYAYKMGYNEMGYDIVQEIAEQAASQQFAVEPPVAAPPCVWRDGCRNAIACAIKGHCDAPPAMRQQFCPHCGKSEPHTHRVSGEPVVFPSPVEPPCSATWQPFVGGEIVPCTLPAGHGGKHRAPEPFSEEEKLRAASQGQIDYTLAVTRNAMDSGLEKQQFLRMIALCWDSRERIVLGTENRPAPL